MPIANTNRPIKNSFLFIIYGASICIVADDVNKIIAILPIDKVRAMTDRQARWHRRLEGLSTEPVEPLILNEAMISQWLKGHRAEYNGATETLKACLRHFGLHRRHRKLVWDIYLRTDLGHPKTRRDSN